MENLEIKMVFFNYYAATLGRFYSTNQKDRLLRLMAVANSIDASQVNELIEASRYVENEDIGNPVGCKNFLLCAIFRTNISPILHGAVSALNDIYNTQKCTVVYTNELLWHRSIKKEGNLLDIGYYEYARGKLDKAIEAFEKAMRTEKTLPLVEYLAIISNEAKKYEKAYEYALKAQSLGDDERLQIDWLMEIENEAKLYLTESEREKIEKSVFNQKSTARIGFGQ